MALPLFKPATVEAATAAATTTESNSSIAVEGILTGAALKDAIHRLGVTLRQRKSRANDAKRYEHVPGISREYELVKEVAEALQAAGENVPESVEQEARQLIQSVEASNLRRKAVCRAVKPPRQVKSRAGGTAAKRINAAPRAGLSPRGEPITPVSLVSGATSNSDGSSQNGPWGVARDAHAVAYFAEWLHQGVLAALGNRCDTQAPLIRERSR